MREQLVINHRLAVVEEELDEVLEVNDSYSVAIDHVFLLGRLHPLEKVVFHLYKVLTFDIVPQNVKHLFNVKSRPFQQLFFYLINTYLITSARIATFPDHSGTQGSRSLSRRRPDQHILISQGNLFSLIN